MRGPQADVGAGWWGKLYEENGRGLIWDKSGEKHVKVDDWNEYVIEAAGSRVKTWINGKLCVDLDDAKLSRRGIFALQIHSGGAMEVRFKDFKLEMDPILYRFSDIDVTQEAAHAGATQGESAVRKV